MDRWIVLEPFDTVAVRDGRNFDAGASSLAHSVVPPPTTIAGAIGAAFGAPPGAGTDPGRRGIDVPEQIRGPLVVRASIDGRWIPLFPAPRDMVTQDGRTFQRLRLNRSARVSHDLGDLCLLEGHGDAGEHWWTRSTIERYLRGETDGLSSTDPPWRAERRVGLARDGRVAREGLLYSSEHLRPAGRVGFAAWCVNAPDRPLAQSVRLGGERRRAWVHGDLPEDAEPAWPTAPDTFPDGHLLLYLATPAFFADGWRPAEADLLGGRLVAAAVGGPRPVATASPDPRSGTQRDKSLLWTVEAGSVYYLDFGSPEAAARAAAQWHGKALPQATENLRTAGFGLALVGSW
jgi:CRISPR-associated protein Cmr3